MTEWIIEIIVIILYYDTRKLVQNIQSDNNYYAVCMFTGVT